MNVTRMVQFFLFVACCSVAESQAYSLVVKNETTKSVFVASYSRFRTRPFFDSRTEPVEVAAGAQLSLGLPTVNHLRSVYVNAAFAVKDLPEAALGVSGLHVLRASDSKKRQLCSSVVIRSNEQGALTFACV